MLTFTTIIRVKTSDIAVLHTQYLLKIKCLVDISNSVTSEQPLMKMKDKELNTNHLSYTDYRDKYCLPSGFMYSYGSLMQ